MEMVLDGAPFPVLESLLIGKNMIHQDALAAIVTQICALWIVLGSGVRPGDHPRVPPNLRSHQSSPAPHSYH